MARTKYKRKEYEYCVYIVRAGQPIQAVRVSHRCRLPATLGSKYCYRHKKFLEKKEEDAKA